jgi:hypothetical protein
MKIVIQFFLFVCFISAGCDHARNNQRASRFEEGKPLSELTSMKLKETSGLEASVKNPNMLWAHNDSGNDAEIFLLNENLEIKLTVMMVGIKNRDWEDITVGPGPDSSKTYVYVGDIGDNDAVYLYKHIYRFEEPAFETGNHISVSNFDTITFKLEGTIKDTESLFIDAKSKNLYVVSKREEPVFLYELKSPFNSGDTLTASKILSMPFKEIVAADCSHKNGDILMKNYTNIYYWENRNHEDVITLLKNNPLEISYEQELQGEAIAWATDDSGFYTLSEKRKKEPSYLYFYSRKN